MYKIDRRGNLQKSFYGTDPETFSRNARCEIREIVKFYLKSNYLIGGQISPTPEMGFIFPLVLPSYSLLFRQNRHFVPLTGTFTIDELTFVDDLRSVRR